MNNEQQTYVLRKPVGYKVRNEDANEFVEWRLLVVDGEEFQPITKGNFDALFQPFDVAGLTRQVEESLTFLCQYAYDAGYTIGNQNRTSTGKDVDLSVKATALKIVGLLLNQEKDTK